MAAPGTAPVHISLDPAAAGSGTDDLLAAILSANPRVSDLIFSPGRMLQVQVNGRFAPVELSGLAPLTADDTRRVASHLIGNNKAAITMLREQGYCDISYALAGLARFRVNVFIQRGSCAVVMRVIPTNLPDFKTLGAPEQLKDIAAERSGLALLAGPRGSGKSTTLALLLDHLNQTEPCHIITIEDPIEFLHNHKRATVHQRELHSDTPSIAHAMRAALRQAPNVIVVGELKDHETMDLALDAAETGHLVLATCNAPTARKTIERFVSSFPAPEQPAIHERLARVLRYIVCQRLIPHGDDAGRTAVFEVLAAKALRECLQANGKASAQSASVLDTQIEGLVRAGKIRADIALAHVTDPAAFSRKLGLS